jgi:DNA-binding CsgD family transcriptional regulator
MDSGCSRPGTGGATASGGPVETGTPGGVRDLADAFALKHSLSEAETEILFLSASMFSNKEVAARRGVSERTVQNQWAAICRKVGVGPEKMVIAALLAFAVGEQIE